MQIAILLLMNFVRCLLGLHLVCVVRHLLRVHIYVCSSTYYFKAQGDYWAVVGHLIMLNRHSHGPSMTTWRNIQTL